MKQLRKTKIVGTIGPASEDKLEELFQAGLAMKNKKAKQKRF